MGRCILRYCHSLDVGARIVDEVDVPLEYEDFGAKVVLVEQNGKMWMDLSLEEPQPYICTTIGNEFYAILLYKGIIVFIKARRGGYAIEDVEVKEYIAEDLDAIWESLPG